MSGGVTWNCIGIIVAPTNNAIVDSHAHSMFRWLRPYQNLSKVFGKSLPLLLILRYTLPSCAVRSMLNHHVPTGACSSNRTMISAGLP